MSDAPSSPAPIAEWSVLAANAVGASHQASGRPGQDSVGFGPADHTAKGPLAVAVADGHGHRLHFRSKDGSRLAIEVSCATLLAAAETIAGCNDADGVRSLAAEAVLPELVDRWRAACLADLAARPINVDELEAAGYLDDELSSAVDENDPLLAYGSTLMVAGLAGRWLLLAHIGDGDIFTVGADGTARTPVPGDPLLDGLRTTSLCQPDALGSFRLAVLDVAAGPPIVVGLATDGYGNAQSSDDWQPAVGADLARYLGHEGRAWIGDQLGQWVARCASVEGSADDTTMALLIAPGAEERAAADAPEPHRPGPSTQEARTGLDPAPTPYTPTDAALGPRGSNGALDRADDQTLPMIPAEGAAPTSGWSPTPAPPTLTAPFPTAPGGPPGPGALEVGPPVARETPDTWGWPGPAGAVPGAVAAPPTTPSRAGPPLASPPHPGPAPVGPPPAGPVPVGPAPVGAVTVGSPVAGGGQAPRRGLRGRVAWLAGGAVAALVAAAVAIVLMTGGHSGGPSGGARTTGNPGILGTTTVPSTAGDRSVSPTSGVGTSTTGANAINPGGVQVTTPPTGRSSVPDSHGQADTDPGSLVGNSALTGNS